MLKVLSPGIYTSIQDSGRHGFASYGVPISGAMDDYSAQLANAILNNNTNDAVLEITLGAATFQFLEPTIFCISGADFFAQLNGNPIRLNSLYKVKKNDILIFGKINFGVRVYLAVKGGFLSPIVMKSRSFYVGITHKKMVRKEDIIPYSAHRANDFKMTTRINVNHKFFLESQLDCYQGPEFSLLDNYQKEKLLNYSFTISKENNRMGYRLEEEIDHKLPQMLTSGVLPGTVQLTPSGRLIILMKDCQVTGGYPRVLQLSNHAVSILSQKNTGDTFNFRLVNDKIIK